MTVSTNISNVVARILSVTIILIGSYFIINAKGHVNHDNSIWVLYFTAAALVLLFLQLVISLLGVITVQIDTTSDVITLSGFFLKKTISKNQITGYYNSFSISRGKTFYGLILQFDNGRTLELSEYNIKTVTGIEEYLNSVNINSSGKKRSWFPFKNVL